MPDPLLKFEIPLFEGSFLRRCKRFSVEAQFANETVWVHTNNTGAMLGLLGEGNRILFSKSANPARKMPYTLEFIEADGVWCGVNTSAPNRMLQAAFAAGKFDFTHGYEQIKMEQPLPAELSLEGEKTRFDALLKGKGQPDLWVECKNVTLVKDGCALFPDAATLRGQKHLRQLILLRQRGFRAACFFLIQRNDANLFAPAVEIDPQYAKLFYAALEAGVEMYPYKGESHERGISLGRLLQIADA